MLPHIDFRIDLPKVRAAYNAGELQAQKAKSGTGCLYAGPCAVGVCFDPDTRVSLDKKLYGSVRALIEMGLITAPADQEEDWIRLQDAHDHWKVWGTDNFLPVLEELEKKYAS